MIRPVFARLNHSPLSLRGRVRACPVLDTGVGAFPIILASALLMLLTLAVACGADPTATPVPSQPTAMPPAATEAPAPAATAKPQPVATQVIEGHQPTAPVSSATATTAAPAAPSAPPPRSRPARPANRPPIQPPLKLPLNRWT